MLWEKIFMSFLVDWEVHIADVLLVSVLDREMLTYILESAVSDDLKVVENRGISETFSERICTTGFLVNVP